MKKLLFATALVASVAAFADPINAISFEGYAAGYGFTNGVSELNENGQSDKGVAYFCYKNGDQDGSTVKAYGVGDNLTAPDMHTAYFGALELTNTKYLDLSTEGGTLWRSINPLTGGSGSPYDLGATTNITADGIYLDTLVQFTPTEGDQPPELTDGVDKLAIWLNVDSNTGETNLMVQAKYWYMDGDEPASTPTNFTVSGVYEASKWYRLTVKAVPATVSGAGYFIPAFQISINGTPVESVEPQFATDLQTALGTYWVSPDMGSSASHNQLFPTLAAEPQSLQDVTLQAVGFKGSGALDEIVWTTEDPLASGGGEYQVVIDGSDVTITPQVDDLVALSNALAGAGVTLDVTDVAAVNTALAAPIEGTGTPGIPVWQALFLGVAPTTNGLEAVAIDSITINPQGKVEVEMGGIDPKPGRGVDITLKLMASDDLAFTNPTVAATATSATDFEFAAVQPALGETKKFYKVVVEFAASSNE